MLAAVVLTFGLALGVPFVHRLTRGATGWLLGGFCASLTAWFTLHMEAVAAGDLVVAVYPWVPSLAVHLSLFLDGLSLLFVLPITGIGALVMIYTGAYLAGQAHLGRFYAYMLMFMGSMLGLVLADNLIALWVFWELTSLSSYLLIGYEHNRPTARAAALKALLVTGAGGTALLVGSLLLGQAAGTLELSQLLSGPVALAGHPFYEPILVLVLLGAMTKSAQAPFHFWLPAAMEATTPVSAYLHSATMVTAGVYLLARLTPVLGGTELWHGSLTVIGAVTMVMAAGMALRQDDVKLLLAYSTVSVLGLLIMLLGQGTELGVKAAATYLLAHSLYKGALFLVAGCIDHETGTRHVDRLQGLRRAMPLTALAAGLAAISMAGLPPAFGFIGKELLYETTSNARHAAALLTVAAVITGAVLLAVAGVFAVAPFFGRTTKAPRQPHEAPAAMWLGPILLGTLGIVLGLLPGIAERLVAPAATAILGQRIEAHLALWHGLTWSLALSGITIVCGIVLYAGRHALDRVARPLHGLSKSGPAQGYDLALRSLDRVATAQTRILQNGVLGLYLVTIILTLVALVGYTVATQVPWSVPWRLSGARSFEVMVALLIVSAALLAVTTTSRLTAVVALGVVGYGVALIFVLFSAPDLAMTQFAIETLTVVLFLLVIGRLPRFARLSSAAARTRDLFVASAAGATMTVLVLVSLAVPGSSRLAPFFAEQSVPAAKGHNIVNVILVDFRSLDTLGEIIVLSVAAVGVFALMKLRLREQGP